VLRNLAGLRDPGTLAEHEAQTSTLRLAQLAALTLEGGYDLPHLQKFHRFLFGDIYSWAGELRSVLRQLALDAGHTLAWEHLDSRALVRASQRSLQGDNVPMRNLIETVLDLPET
jgi:fido (protein-threonine AMPylation protein)